LRTGTQLLLVVINRPLLPIRGKKALEPTRACTNWLPVVAPSGYVGVFVFGADNQMYELGSAGGTNRTWYEHGLLPGADRPFYSPSTVAAQSGYAGVFMVGSNYHLYERYFDSYAGLLILTGLCWPMRFAVESGHNETAFTRSCISYLMFFGFKQRRFHSLLHWPTESYNDEFLAMTRNRLQSQ